MLHNLGMSPIALYGMVLSACEEPYGSNCPLGDINDPCAHVCGLPKDHDGGHGGCDCGS